MSRLLRTTRRESAFWGELAGDTFPRLTAHPVHGLKSFGEFSRADCFVSKTYRERQFRSEDAGPQAGQLKWLGALLQDPQSLRIRCRLVNTM